MKKQKKKAAGGATPATSNSNNNPVDQDKAEGANAPVADTPPDGNPPVQPDDAGSDAAAPAAPVTEAPATAEESSAGAPTYKGESPNASAPPEAGEASMQPRHAPDVQKHIPPPPVFEMRSIASLRPHPLSLHIYGDTETVVDLLDDIKTNGLIHPPVVTKDGIILCGHRRVRSLKALRWTEIQVQIFESDERLEQKIRLLGDNVNRKKTKIQIAAEAKLRLEIKTEQAALRMKNAPKAGGMANLPQQETGAARDAVGKEMGMSGTTVAKAVKIADAHEKLKAQGKDDDVAELKAATNKSFSAGLKAAVAKGLIATKKPNPKKSRNVTPASAAKTQPAPPPSANPGKLDSDRAMELADQIVTFLRNLKPDTLTGKQKDDWKRLFAQIDDLRAEHDL
ncbi:MAG: ParB N-terminal domain-containing protein [Verrucomicrobiota bacterium]